MKSTDSNNFLWGHNRRFNSYAEYFRREFGGRVQKVSVDAGFTCPNRDGSIGYGGCTYCNNEAFNPSYCSPEKSITRQIKEGIEFHRRRYRRAEKFLVYFQAYSNTYDTLERLKRRYEEALSADKVAGLVIGTRPDCIDDEKLDYLAQLSRDYYIILEYGLESCYDQSLRLVNRGHTFADSVEALKKTAEKGLKSGVHMIFGLPGESIQQITGQAEILSGLPITTLKIHQLQIVKNTVMASQYRKQPETFRFFSICEYVDLVIDFIERLNPAIVIERFAGEVPPRFLESPDWGPMRYDVVLQRIENRLAERDTWQGKLYNPQN
ncbi:MAG: TIGR01212 family radical SAM protein [Sphingobacteriia bacterium]|nr:TIGR01212 family radical SAM protein [Sphingobacteriia bacterium]